MEVLTLARHGDVKELVELTSSNKLNVNGRIELVGGCSGWLPSIALLGCARLDGGQNLSFSCSYALVLTYAGGVECASACRV